jgi:16S rRNA (uracil1498-N3)-methyltransferase
MIPLFFVEQTLSIQQSITLNNVIAKHLKVLRVNTNDHLELFDPTERRFLCRVDSVKPNTQVTIIDQLPCVEQPMANFQLALALSQPQKIEWIIQKVCEIGVIDIQLVQTDHGRWPEHQWPKKQQRLQTILIQACQQSRRTTIPKLAAPISLENWSQLSTNKFFLCPHAKVSTGWPAKPEFPTSVIIGPESGWSLIEKNLLIKSATAIHLGESILRCETAAISAAVLAKAHWYNWQSL